MAKRKGNDNDDGGSGKKAKKDLTDEGNTVSVIAISWCVSSDEFKLSLPEVIVMSTYLLIPCLGRHNTHLSYLFDNIFYLHLINMMMA